jgi:D-citramalate synthase
VKIEIMDTTLRDGEQTRGVSFNAREKLSIAKLLINELKVDRIEVGSARVSEGEFEALKKIANWAKENGIIKKIEALGFIDGTLSIDWLKEAGIRTVNLLSKGSLNHVQGQLGKTPHEHVADIKEVINYADNQGFDVNLYLEDWSNGMIHSPEYVFFLVDELNTRI